MFIQSPNRHDHLWTARVSTSEIKIAEMLDRPEIVLGQTYTLYSTSEGAYADDPDPALYTGSSVKVIDHCHDWDAETDWGKQEGLERGYVVETAAGTRFEVYEGEINGWYRDTGQYITHKQSPAGKIVQSMSEK